MFSYHYKRDYIQVFFCFDTFVGNADNWTEVRELEKEFIENLK